MNQRLLERKMHCRIIFESSGLLRCMLVFSTCMCVWVGGGGRGWITGHPVIPPLPRPAIAQLYNSLLFQANPSFFSQHTMESDERDDSELSMAGYCVKMTQEVAGFGGDTIFGKAEMKTEVYKELLKKTG